MIAHFLLVRLAPTYCQQTQDSQPTFLLTIKSNQSGLEIRTYPLPENHGYVDNSGARLWPAHELRPQVHFIPDRRLSSGCGEQNFRCQELLVETCKVESGTLSVVLVPLEDGVLVLFSKWNNSNSATLDWNTVIKNTTNCSPTVFYKISHRLYMVCINSRRTLDIFVYEIQLNVNDSVIEKSDIHVVPNITSLAGSNIISNLSLTSDLSKFVVFKDKIIVAIDNIIASIDVRDSDSTKNLTLKTCPQIHYLVPTFDTQYGQMLVALCTDGIMYINCDQNGSLIEVQHYTSNGSELHVCPDNEYNATLTLLRLTLLQNYNITVNISSGICFKTLNRTYFAYSDQNLNRVFVYDFITQNISCVSPYYCPNMNCPLVVENKYLVVREVNHGLVFDTTNNFSLVINISVGLSDILAILDLHIINVNSAVTPSPPVTSHENTTTSSIPSTTPGIILVNLL